MRSVNCGITFITQWIVLHWKILNWVTCLYKHNMIPQFTLCIFSQLYSHFKQGVRTAHTAELWCLTSHSCDASHLTTNPLWDVTGVSWNFLIFSAEEIWKFGSGKIDWEKWMGSLEPEDLRVMQKVLLEEAEARYFRRFLPFSMHAWVCVPYFRKW